MKIAKYILPFVLATSLIGCSNLQDGLHDEMVEKLNSETGSASINGSTWYYNGTLNEDMTSESKQSLLLNFGKKIALGTLSGNIELNYTNASGNSVTENFTTLSGTFTDDLQGYKLNLNEIMSYFDSEKIPSGKATMNIKVGGFKCAEGNQNGRPISSFEAKNIKIQPLYDFYNIDYSTCGFSSSSKIEYDLKGDVQLANGNYTISATGSDSNTYEFEVSAENTKIILTPKFQTAPADGVSVDLTLKDILPINCGNAYSKDISIKFSSHKIVIDGKLDSNFTNEEAVVYEDKEDDQKAFSALGYDVSSQADLKKVYITNDDDYLYIGVSGNLKITWKNTLSVLVSNGKVTGGNGARSEVLGATSEDYATKTGTRTKVQPNVYLTHQIGAENDGNGYLSAFAYVSSANSDITSKIGYSPKGWTDTTCGEFVEYAIPLSDSGLSKNDEVSVIVTAALHWDDGNAIVDSATDESVISVNSDNTSVKYDFNNGIKYTIK